MTDSWSEDSAPGRDPGPAIDTSVAHPARVYDYWLGGKDNYPYPADRAAGAAAAEASPNILNRWRPGPDDPVLEHDLPTYCGIGQKP